MTPGLSPTSYVVFLDLLGFSALVKAHPDKVVYATNPGDETRIHVEETDSWRRFSAFHNILENIHLRSHVSQAERSLIFSDCAFVVAHEIRIVADIAIDLMRLFLRYQIPVRMGLASGTFHAHRFSSDTTVTTTLTRAVFYGTAVVCAHETEKDSGPGCRIFLHSGLTPDALDQLRVLSRVIPLPAPNSSCGYELSYIADTNVGTEHDDDDTLIEGVLAMYRDLPSPVPDRIALHYTETLAAINRMRAASRKPLYGATLART